jgi:EF-hand domain pair
MGCSCTKNKKIASEILEPDLGRIRSIMVGSTLQSLKPGSPYSHCNVLVWTETIEDFHSHFPKTFVRYLAAPNFPMTFNLVPYVSYDFSSAIIIDCLVILTENQDVPDLNEIYSKFIKVCVHILVSSLKTVSVPNFIIIPTLDELYNQLYVQQLNLEKILREIFYGMDENFDETISKLELGKAIIKLGAVITQKKLDDIMDLIDLNKDGKINFQEFSYWWKRGRQGGKSLESITSKWLDHIKKVLPGMSRFSEKKFINKTKLYKKIIIDLKNRTESKLKLKINLGKSAKREEILKKMEETMKLNINEFWVAVNFKAKSQELCLEYLNVFEDMAVNLKNTLLAYTLQGSDLCNNIKHKVKAIDENLCLSFIFDDLAADQSAEFLQEIEKVFVSPVDDCCFLTINSERNITEINTAPGNNLLDSIGGGEITIESENWYLLAESITPVTSFHNLIQDFLRFEGTLVLKDPAFTDLDPIIIYLNKVFGYLNNIQKSIPLISDVLNILETYFLHEFSVYFRYLNLGIEVSIDSQDLITYIKEFKP